MGNKKSVNAAKTGQRRKPRLGQNFLRDASAAQKIVSALGDISDRTVIEIGPGRGVLTEILAASARRLMAIELDRSLAAQLRMNFVRYSNVEIIEADVLQVNLPNLIARRPAPLLGTSLHAAGEQHERADVIGNIPYYITSEVLLHLLESHEWLETIVIMVQREVADRIVASPGSRDYGLLSATVQLFCRVERLFTLSPDAFSPSPKVHSSVLRMKITPRAAELGVNADEFLAFLKRTFAQKRKTLSNNLKPHFPADSIEAAFRSARIRPDARAETLSLEQMARIHKSLASATRPSL